MEYLTAQLLLYSGAASGTVLGDLADIFQDYHRWKEAAEPGDTPDRGEAVILTRRIHASVKRLLDIATEYAFDENLWQDYLTLLLLTDENSFSLISERSEPGNGTADEFARRDFEIFRRLFHYDFSGIERDLGVTCFTGITHYRSIEKTERSYNKNVSDKVRAMSPRLAKAKDAQEFYDLMTEHYHRYGVGMLGLNKAFRIRSGESGVSLIPIYNTDKVVLSDLIGYESQKRELRANTEAFLSGRPANNALLYGDAGTGKSSSVKALINEYYDQGLRMIEIYKYQFRDLSNVIAKIKNRNYRFIIFIDDLSFEENEVEYKFLKAVIEGGVETRPENMLIYATSNRRNLIRETWKDRADMEFDNDVHRSDTVEEKLSLSARFGCRICFTVPRRRDFDQMVLTLAHRAGIKTPDDELLKMANRWEIAHGGVSGRTAQQFVDAVGGREQEAG